ncbi:hypothetical protein BS78_03G208300 [Paspalum vaginatum]|nr:hypothetical protein BS78_03G208300 [Paspalum vaginatum]
MGGCCCCFLAPKPPRENPTREHLMARGPSVAGYRCQPPMVNYIEGLDAEERLKVGFRTFKKNIYDQNPLLFEPLKFSQSPKRVPHLIREFCGRWTSYDYKYTRWLFKRPCLQICLPVKCMRPMSLLSRSSYVHGVRML